MEERVLIVGHELAPHYKNYIHFGFVPNKLGWQYRIIACPPEFADIMKDLEIQVFLSQLGGWHSLAFKKNAPKTVEEAKDLLSTIGIVRRSQTKEEVESRFAQLDCLVSITDKQTLRKEQTRMQNEPGTTDSTKAATSLMTKEHEPLIIRKFTNKGFPLYIALICGANLDNLDTVVMSFMEENDARIKDNSIQMKRNLCGELTERLVKTYGVKTEGVAVLWYVDKMWVSSLFGDFMNHAPCKLELFTLLSIMPHI